jgi:hypothetical protein
MTETIICKTCGLEKPALYEYKRGYKYKRGECRECIKKYNSEYGKKRYRKLKSDDIYHKEQSALQYWRKKSDSDIQSHIEKLYAEIERKQKYADALEEIIEGRE